MLIFVVDVEERFPCDSVEAVECARQSQVFYRLAVAGREIHTFHNIVNVFVRAVFLSFFKYGGYGIASQSFYSGEAKANVTILVGTE